MHIPAGTLRVLAKDAAASTSGGRIIRIECDRCHFEFFYELWRSARGVAVGARFGSEKASPSRARELAHGQLHLRLEQDSELVACPKCNWVNQALIKVYRYRYRALPWLVLFFSALFAGALKMTDEIISESNQAYAMSANHFLMRDASIAIFAGAFPIGLLVQAWLHFRICPNSTFPGIPVLPAGSPPALIAHEDPAGVTYEAADHERQELPRTKGSWIYFRWGQLVLPSACCRCMGKATTRYSAPSFFDGGRRNIAMPLCDACSAKTRANWWWGVVQSVFGMPTICWAAIMLAPGIDAGGKWALVIFAAFFAVLTSLIVLPGFLSRPYRLRRVDRLRGIFRIRTGSEEFNRLLAAAVRQRESRVFVAAEPSASRERMAGMPESNGM